MRIYEGSPRQDFEEVLRSIGAHLDGMGMREVLLLEVSDGFIVQGLVIHGAGTWSEAIATSVKETVILRDNDISSFMDEALERRGQGRDQTPDKYESGFRVIGKYLDTERPRDVFFFEQDGAYVLRLLRTTQTGAFHELVEFTKADIDAMIAGGPIQRASAPGPKAGKST